MKKNLLILFTLILVLSIALSITATCFAEDEALPITEEAQPVEQEAENATPDNDAGEWFSNIWQKIKVWAIGAFSGLSLGAIVSAIFVVVIKRALNKGIDKIESKTEASTISDSVSKNIEDHFAKTTIDVNIAPLMERQYLLLSQKVYADLDVAIKKVEEKYMAMVKCFEKLGHYYDGSIGVTDVQKQEFYDAVEYAKSLAEEEPKTTAKIAVEVTPEKTEEKKTTKSVAEPY